MLLSTGEFYGFNLRTASLELLRRFFAKYLEYADHSFLSVKVGILHFLGCPQRMAGPNIVKIIIQGHYPCRPLPPMLLKIIPNPKAQQPGTRSKPSSNRLDTMISDSSISCFEAIYFSLISQGQECYRSSWQPRED
jgi:hypothetical protein